MTGHLARPDDLEPAVPAVEASVIVTHGIGLHARPSVTFTRLAKAFPCAIEMAVNDGPWFNAKSIVKVVSARIRKGSVMRLRAEGIAAREAVLALSDLVRRDFDEDRGHGQTG